MRLALGMKLDCIMVDHLSFDERLLLLYPLALIAPFFLLISS